MEKNLSIITKNSNNAKYQLNKILTDNYLGEDLIGKIKRCLPESKAYGKMNKERKANLNLKFNELFISEEETTLFNNKSSIPKHLEKNAIKFEKTFKVIWAKEPKRMNQGTLKNEMGWYITHLLNKFRAEGVKDIKMVTAKKILKKIKANVLFDKVLLQPFSVAVDQTFHVTTKVVKEECLDHGYSEMPFSYVNSLIKVRVLLHLSYLILEKSKWLHSKMEEISDQSFLWISPTEGKKGKFFQNVAYQLIEIFLEVFYFKKETFFIPKIKKSTMVIKMPIGESSKFISRKNFFEIVPPANDFSKSSSRISAKKSMLSKGSPCSSMSLSKKAIESLNLVQSKKFMINENVLQIFEDLDLLQESFFKNIKLYPFVPKSILEKMIFEINELKKTINPKDIVKVKEFWKGRTKGWDNDLLSDMSKKTKLNKAKLDDIYEFSLKKKELKKYILLRKQHNTKIQIAKIFRGFPIYFKETLDYRARMYPSTKSINRTSGIYKYLLQDFEKRTIKKVGLRVLLQALYEPFTEQYEELNSLKVKTANELELWHKKNIKINIKSILKCKSPIYKLSIFYEMKSLVEQEFKSGILVEIDQKNSSSVFAALILRDKKLASVCNLESKTKSDLGSWLMVESKSRYKNKISENSLEILTSNRTIHKKLLMCFYFGQTHFGRMEDLRIFIPSYKDCEIIADDYNKFLDDSLPGLVEKRDLLNGLAQYVLKKTNSKIRLKTIDLSHVDWFFPTWEKKQRQRTFHSGLNNKTMKYRENVYTKKLNIRKMILGFLANYIHSLDAALLRLIILEIKKTCNYVVSHLHDSVQFHPNHYKKVLKSIKNVYSSCALRNIFDRTFVNVMKKQLKESDLPEFELLVDRFKASGENIKIKEKFFNVKWMYIL